MKRYIAMLGGFSMLGMLAGALPVAGQDVYQILVNGSFESGAAGSAPASPYVVSAEPGSSALLSSAAQSPFQNVYPVGAQSLRLVDGAAAQVQPNVRQGFDTQFSETLLWVNFDFMIEGSLGDPDNAWSVQVDDAIQNRASFIAVINGRENNIINSFSIVGSGSSVPLEANLWYNVSAEVNLVSRLISGQITPFGSASSSFTAPVTDGAFHATHFDIGDFSTTANRPIYLDNLSLIGVVPEPSLIPWSAAGLLALAGCRRWTRRRAARR